MENRGKIMVTASNAVSPSWFPLIRESIINVMLLARHPQMYPSSNLLNFLFTKVPCFNMNAYSLTVNFEFENE